MKKFSAITSFLLLLATLANAQDYVLTPFQDASVGYSTGTNDVNTNYGHDQLFAAFSQPDGSGGVNAGRGLMQFDLSMIPPGTVIADARLDLFGSGAVGGSQIGNIGSTGHNACFLERITSPWTDSTVTFNTQPSVTHINRVYLPHSTSVDENYLHINVTAMVQNMVNHPNKSYGFRLKLRKEVPTKGLLFWSTNGAPSSDQYATLKITLGQPKLQSVSNEVVSTPRLNSNIAPNPFHDNAQINFANDLSNSKAELRIYNLFGQIVRTMDVSGKASIVIERNNLAQGLYHFVVISNQGIIESGKFIIE